MASQTAHVVIDGPGYASVAIELREGITTLGRLPANDIVLNDQQVSRHHARISFFEREATFQDLESHNGSLVNDATTQTCILADRDVIRVGPFRLRFVDGPAEQSGDAYPTSRSVPGLETLSRRSAVNQLSSLLLRAIDNTLVTPTEDALARTLAAVDQAFHADRSALVRRRGDGRLAFVHGREEGQTSDLPSVPNEVVEWVAQRRFPVSSEDPSSDPRFTATESNRPAACVPIGSENLWGVLYVERTTPSFSLSDLDGLQAVAHLLFAFVEGRLARRPPWRVDAEPTGLPQSLRATVIVLELATRGVSVADTISDAPVGDPWDADVLAAVAEAAQRYDALWIGHDDRRVLLACPESAGSSAETQLVLRLERIFQRAPVVRMSLVRGPITLRDVPLSGATRLFASGEAVTAALELLRAAAWGELVAPTDRADRLRSGGLRVRTEDDRTVRVQFARTAVTP